MDSIVGGCHCGQVRYELTEALSFQFLCYCKDCNTINGGCRLAGAGLSESGLKMTGQTKKYTYKGGKGDIESHFCGNCGTPLFAFPKAHEGVVVMRANTFDDPNVFQPENKIFEDHACAFDKQSV